MSQAAADEYARWFRCLADGTRIRVLNIVARSPTPLTVGEVVEQVGRSQSTVSRHLRVLADACFIIAEPDGVRTRVRVNEACMSELPRAASEIMHTAITPRKQIGSRTTNQTDKGKRT